MYPMKLPSGVRTTLEGGTKSLNKTCNMQDQNEFSVTTRFWIFGHRLREVDRTKQIGHQRKT